MNSPHATKTVKEIEIHMYEPNPNREIARDKNNKTHVKGSQNFPKQ